MKFSGNTHLDALIGWKPRAWMRSERRLWSGNGRRKPKGRAYTAGPASIRRKARSLARRKAA